ncbi:MAG: hypothetical protein ACK5O7_02255 [Holosporales bacterium]
MSNIQSLLSIKNTIASILCTIFFIGSPYLIYTHQWILTAKIAEARVIGENDADDRYFIIEYIIENGEIILQDRHKHPKSSLLRGQNVTFYLFYDPQNPQNYLDLLSLSLLALAFAVGCTEVVRAYKRLRQKPKHAHNSKQ